MSNYSVVVAVDPGIQGGICIIKNNDIPKLYRIPVKKITVNKKDKNVYDMEGISSIIEPYVNDRVVFVQEIVGVHRGEGSVSSFGFGKSSGVTLGFAWGKGFEVVEVSPQTWKKAFPDLVTDLITALKVKRKEINEVVKKLSLKTLKEKELKKQNNKQIKLLKKDIETINRQIKTEAKAQARRIISNKYPTLVEEVKLVRDDGKADATLIALWYKDYYK
jgi:hypothetical protein